MKPFYLALLAIFIFLSVRAFCQPQKDTSQITPLIQPQTQVQTNEPPKQKVVSGRDGFLTDIEFDLSISVLLFGTLVFCLEVYLIKVKQIGHEYIAKIILVTLIVTGTLFLITAGYNNDQIAPATGLLGTIAGYLLGRTSAVDSAAATNNKAVKNEE